MARSGVERVPLLARGGARPQLHLAVLSPEGELVASRRHSNAGDVHVHSLGGGRFEHEPSRERAPKMNAAAGEGAEHETPVGAERQVANSTRTGQFEQSLLS